MAGLAAAQALATSNQFEVVIHEAKPHAGGRRRSFYDSALGLDIDTGNFPVLSGWRSTLALIDAAGARSEWREAREPGVAFADFATGERWRLRPNSGRLPWWLLLTNRRGTRLNPPDYWAARRLLSAPAESNVASIAPRSRIAMERLWRPLVLAGLNCPPEVASARLAGSTLRSLALEGGRGMNLLTPAESFGRGFVEPVTRLVQRGGATFRFARRLAALETGPERIGALEFEHDRIDLGARDAVILATPWPVSALLIPGLEAPRQVSSTLTAHFAAPSPLGVEAVTGALSGAFHWLFCYRDRLSITINDAAAHIDGPKEVLAAACWRGISLLTGLSDRLPAWRFVATRRGGFLATAEEAARRPPCRTAWRNLFLAGGYVDSPMPGLLEGSVRSGEAAARAYIRQYEQ